MKIKPLLTHRFKRIGVITLIPFLILGCLNIYNDFTLDFLTVKNNSTITSLKDYNFTDYNLTNEVALSGIIIALLMIAFAREKSEDEFIHHIRLESWQWAILINYGLLFIANWLIYGTDFLMVMVYNMLTILIIFIIRFNWLLYRYKKQVTE